MINTIYLDMDGVICDFRKQCKNYNCIEGYNVDWKPIHDAGPEFWETIDWTKDGYNFYKWLVRFTNEEDIELYILSSVNFVDGKIGKERWLENNTNFDKNHIIIVDRGEDKADYASPTALLIDDFGKNCDLFKNTKKKGHAVKYKNMDQAIDDILIEYTKG